MIFARRKKPSFAKPDPNRRVHELEIITARLIRAGFAGEYHAAFHGRGIEFSQVREYQPGDDIRTIDWNVTARSGVPHVKEFIEERDLTVVVAMDVSASMAFGSVDRRKIDLANELVSILAFAAVQNGDRVGLLLFADDVVRYLPPRRGRLHVQALVRTALAAGDALDGRARFEAVASFLDRVLVKRAVVIVLSDFLASPFERAMRRLNHRHDVIACALSDPREEHFPARGLVTLADAETGQTRTVDLARNDVRQLAAARVAQLQEGFRKSGVDLLRLSTAVPYDRPLLRFFEQRIARNR